MPCFVKVTELQRRGDCFRLGNDLRYVKRDAGKLGVIFVCLCLPHSSPFTVLVDATTETCDRSVNAGAKVGVFLRRSSQTDRKSEKKKTTAFGSTRYMCRRQCATNIMTTPARKWHAKGPGSTEPASAKQKRVTCGFDWMSTPDRLVYAHLVHSPISRTVLSKQWCQRDLLLLLQASLPPPGSSNR